MSDADDNTKERKGRTSKLSIAALLFAGILPFAPIGFILGIIALTRIKKSKGRLTGRAAATIAIVCGVIVVFVFVSLIIMIMAYNPSFPFPEPRPFTECDPNKAINLIRENFDFTLPDSIKSAKAAETRTSWLEHNYIFILKFTCDLKGWEQFHTSFPKIKDF